MKLRVLLVILSLLGTACGSETTVGAGLEGGEGGVGGALRSTPTPEPATPAPDDEGGEEQATPPPATPQPEQQEAPPEQQEVSVEAEITDQGFEPSYLVVPLGGKVRYWNRLSKPASVTETHGAFDSGQIEPGQAWVRTFDEIGPYQCPQSTKQACYDLQDGSRPYVTGTIEVVRT